MKQSIMKYEFVEFIPAQVQEGVLYISIPHSTAIHQCACGCGSEVVTPLHPTGWEVSFNGEAVSLNPSIGNWSFPCQSHYWITRNKIRWARKWTTSEIEEGRAYDRELRSPPGTSGVDADTSTKAKTTRSAWRRLKKLMS